MKSSIGLKDGRDQGPKREKINCMKNLVFNTGETSNDLRHKYNPEGSLLRELQQRMLDMLLYLDSVCKKLNIEYYLDGGTCLGAVRHGGFIPWDDDMDVVVDVKDYNRLCDYLVEHPHPRFILHNRKTDDNYYVGWAKLRDKYSESIYEGDNIYTKRQENIFKYSGVMIDLFPYSDHVLPFPHKVIHGLQNRIQRRYFVGKHKLLADIMYFFLFIVLKPLANILGFLFSNRKMYAHDYLSHNTVYRFKKDRIYPLKDVEFEGHIFKIPKDVDYFLRILYGNYMTLPNENARNHHSYSFRLLDK